MTMRRVTLCLVLAIVSLLAFAAATDAAFDY